MATSGVVYFNNGTKCTVRLIVAIHSLRKFWSGPIAVFMDGTLAKELAPEIEKWFGVQCVFDTSELTSSLLRKIEIGPKTPFENTVYLDADTLVVGKIDELFEESQKYDFVGVNFANWRSDGSKVGARTRSFKDICSDEYIDTALKYGPAINTGVYAYRKDTPMFTEWLDLAKKGDASGRMQIPDEIAFQVLAPQYNVKVMPSKFNVSVVYDENCEDMRVIHFHGRKNCRNFKLARLWIQEFIECLKENACNIHKYIDRQYGDRRLNDFLNGNDVHPDLQGLVQEALGKKKEIPMKIEIGQPALNLSPIQEELDSLDPADGMVVRETIIPQVANDITIVTAVDKKYLGHLKVSFPNWIKHKRLDRYPFLVYVNGFDNLQDEELRFLWEKPYVTLKAWNLVGAESQRENMLSAFVLGAGNGTDITTKWWVKLDADSFATDNSELITESMKGKYVMVGHRWRYSKPPFFVSKMDEWAKGIPELKDSPILFDKKYVDGSRFNHPQGRIASYVCLHKTEFVQYAARLAGKRLPIASHDTYLSILAIKMGLPILGHNFKKRSGFSNWSDLEKLKIAVAETDVKYP